MAARDLNQARSRAIDRLRYEQRKKRVDPLPTSPLPHGDWVNSSDEAIAFEQQKVQLRDALEVLTPDERRAIEAAFFGELSHGEVAERLQEPLGTVKTRIRSALNKLRQVLVTEVKVP